MERTLILVKPDGVKRAVVGEILSRLERTGLKIAALKIVHIDKEFAGKHYTYEDIAVRRGEKVRNDLIDFITSGPVVAAVIEGVESISIVRKLCGETEPKKSLPGTIRGDYCHHSFAYCNENSMAIQNVIHASANQEDAAKEVPLWFKPEEFVSYKRADEACHYKA